jgi:uncharacterized membrane protein
VSQRKGRGKVPHSKPTNTIVVPESPPPSVEGRTETALAARYEEFEAQFFAGPLPPPEALAEYDRICPGAADRILAMAEAQAHHRQSLEARVIRSNCRSQDLGPILGFLLAAGVIAIGCYLVLQGKEISGLVALVSALAAIVVPFVYGKRKQAAELAEKRERLANPPRADWDYSGTPGSAGLPEGRDRSLRPISKA